MKNKNMLLVVLILVVMINAYLIQLSPRITTKTNDESSITAEINDAQVFIVRSKVNSHSKPASDHDVAYKVQLSTDPVILRYLFYRIISEDSGVSDPSGGSSTVYGKVVLYNDYAKSTSSLYIPVAGLYVNAYDIDGGEPKDFGYINASDSGGGDYDYLGYARTDSYGKFVITFGSQDGAMGAYGTQDVFLQFFADIESICRIVDASGRVYQYRMYNDSSDVPDGQAATIYVAGAQRTDKFGNIIYANDGAGARYLNDNGKTIYYVLGGPEGTILSIISSFADDFSSIEAIYNIPTVDIWFPSNTTKDYGAVYYFNISEERIWAPGFFEVNYTQLIYAYAQYLLWYAYGQNLAFFKPIYNKSVRLDEWSAWVNGWSIFMAEWFIEKHDDDYWYWLQGLEKIYDSDYSHDDDNLAWEVAALLWDLYDNVNDDQDGDGYGDEISVSLNQMWYVIKQYKPANIQDFLNYLIDYVNLDRATVWKVAWEHGINIDHEPPTRPSIYSYSPPANKWINDSYIYISWTASFDAVSGLDHYVVHAVNAITGEPYRDYLVNASTTYWSINDMPSGEWYFSVGAVDVAGNENTSASIGPIKIDTLPPQPLDYGPSVGVEYVDNITDNLKLWVEWDDGPSGIDSVYFRYKIGDNWSDWILASYDSTNNYYYVILDQDTWKSAGGHFLYWDSKAVDKAGNVMLLSSYFGMPYIKVIDDDSEAPDVSLVRHDIMDNSTSDYRIEFKATDDSGIYNVTLIVHFGDLANYTYYNNSIVWGADNTFYVDIPWNIWINYVEQTVYVDIYAWDNDYDWSGDRALRHVYVYYGYIYDDDITPPVILNATFIEVGGSDGVVEADEAFDLRIEAYDPSGVNYTIGLDWGSGTKYFVATALFDNGTYAILLIRNISLGIGNVNISIVISDLDRDRAGDYASGINTNFGIRIPKERVEITVSSSEINVNYNESFEIIYNVTRNDGGIIPLNGTNVTILIFYEGDLIKVFNDTFEGNNTAFTISPIRDLNVTNGALFIKLFIRDNVFESNNATLWVYVWIYSEISIEVSNSTPIFGQTITFTVNLTKENGDPLVGEWVSFYLDNGTALIRLGSNSTDSNGIAVFNWIVSVGQGNYTLIARYAGSQLFYIRESQVSTLLTIDKGYGNVVAFDASIVFTDGGIIVGYVNDSYGNPIPHANVSLYVYVSGEWIYIASNLSDIDGYVKFYVGDNLEEVLGGLGNYSYCLILEEDNRFYGSEDSAIVSYIKDILDDVRIHADTSYVGWGDKLLITINAYDDEGEPIVEGIVNVTIVFDNGTVYNSFILNMKNGMASFEFDSKPIMPISKLMIYATAQSDYYNGTVSAAYRILVVKENAYVLISNINNWTWEVEYNISSMISITIIDDDGQKVVGNGEMTVDIEGYTLYEGSIKPINITYPLLDLMPGTYYITIRFVSQYYDLPSTVKIILVVDPIQTQVSVIRSIDSVGYGDTISIIVQVNSTRGEPVPDAVVAVFVEKDNFSEYIGSFKANDSGIAEIRFNMTFVPGDYNIRIEALASVLYGASSTKLTVAVVKEKVNILVEVSRNPQVGERAWIFVKLIDDDNHTVYGAPIGVYLGDRVLSETMVYGSINITWVPESPGKKLLRVIILNNSYYEADSYAHELRVYGSKSTTSSWVAVPIIASVILGGAGVGMFVRKRRMPTSIVEESVEEALETESEFSDVIEEFFDEFGEL